MFSNIILMTEGRTPPKTQADLLEAMQERSVTASGQRFDLAKPFFVLATESHRTRKEPTLSKLS